MIHGSWYPKDSSAEHVVELFLEGKEFIIYHENELLLQGDAELLVFSDRIGNIPRKITLPDGSLFATKDNDAIDDWLSVSRHKASRPNYLFLLESRWRWVATSLVVTIAFVFVSIYWGLPWTSKKVAYIIPSEASQMLSDNTMKLLDKILFEPSNLSAEQQHDLTQHFVDKLLPSDSNDFSYTLHFRHMPSSLQMILQMMVQPMPLLCLLVSSL